MKKSELKQIIKEEIYKILNQSVENLSESQKLNVQQEMDQLLEDGKIRLKKIQQSMKSKGYEI